MSLFTPTTGLLGGSLIGAAASTLLLTNGDIMGLSGILRSVIYDEPPWKYAFIASFLVATQVFLHTVGVLTPPVVKAPTLLAYIIGGFCVGLGTKIGNGCTSGHGICGLARLSKRSLASVVTFCAVGIATAVLTATTPSLESAFRTSDIPANNPKLGYAVTVAGLALAFSKTRPITKKVYGAIASALICAFGLWTSGMASTAKVFGFLEFQNIGTSAYDPTLITVLGSGVVASFVGYKLKNLSRRPFFGDVWCIPNNQTIDAKLLTGSAFFGMGWALAGMCPGPALCLAGGGANYVIQAWFPAFWLGSHVGELIENKKIL